MTVEVTERDGVPVALVAGALDVATAPDLTEALRSAVPNAALGLVIDLREITHVDSAGLHVLFEIIQRLDRRQQRLLVVIAPQSLVADVVVASDLASYAGVGADLDAAVAELRPTPA
jgi:anti-anti-sigma factor